MTYRILADVVMHSRPARRRGGLGLHPHRAVADLPAHAALLRAVAALAVVVSWTGLYVLLRRR